MNLTQLTVSNEATVCGFDQQGGVNQSRFMSLGVIPGSYVRIIRRAPLGSLLQVKVGATLLSIRKEEAEQVLVEVQP